MKIKATTYTVLVTIHHEGTPPTPAQVAAQVHQGLEEGTREHASQVAACVDAFPGDIAGKVASLALSGDVLRARRLHDDLRANP